MSAQPTGCRLTLVSTEMSFGRMRTTLTTRLASLICFYINLFLFSPCSYIISLHVLLKITFIYAFRYKFLFCCTVLRDKSNLMSADEHFRQSWVFWHISSLILTPFYLNKNLWYPETFQALETISLFTAIFIAHKIEWPDNQQRLNE